MRGNSWGSYKMANKAKNKYSMEADDFGLPPTDPMSGMGGMDGGMDMGGIGGDMGFGGGGGADNGGISHASNGLFPQDVIPVRGAKRLWRLLRISFQANRPKTQKEKKINLFAYNQSELKYQPGFMRGFLDQSDNPTSLYNYLTAASQRAAAWEREAKSTNTLSPEIEAAKDIMVASILSPVDLQTGAINVEVTDKSLPEEVQGRLSQIISDYVNNDLKLSRRLTKWLGNALYQSGAAPILVLPQSNIETLKNLNDLEYAGFLDKYDQLKPTKRPEKQQEIVSGEAYISGNASFEGLNIKVDSDSYKAFINQTVNDCIASVERLDFIEKTEATSLHKNKDKFEKEIQEVINKSKNFVRFSTDVKILSKHQTDIRSKLEKIQRDIDKRFVINRVDPIYVLNTEAKKDVEEIEAPTLIELPYQCVIPIIVPGAPNQHIGYFILVNQWGEPLNPDTRDINDLNANSRLMESNIHAMFGVPSAVINMERSPMQQFRVTSSIFGNILRHLMEHKLEEYGLGGTQIQQHEAITTCLMRNMLDSRMIGLVFVPEPMLTYYRFDVHPDGTGKSLIEDIRTITGLRTTLVTSDIMAATENSIDHKTVEVNVGDMNVNSQQLMEQIKNAFTEKRIMRYDNNPLNIQRDLIQKSLTVVPKGIKGLQDGLNITTEHRQTGAIGSDQHLLETLGDWLIQALKVPKSVITKTGDEEFARSVVTTNLFFNNRVKIIQQDVNDYTTKLIRCYIKYSYPLRKKIITELSVSEKDYHDTKQDINPGDAKSAPEFEAESMKSLEAQALSEKQVDEAEKKAEKLRKKDTNPPKSGEEIETNKTTIYEQLQSVIDNTFVKLPEPRIVVDKAQTEEINTFAQCIDQVLNTVYSDELLPDDYAAYHGVLRMFRAREKSRLIKEFIKKVGYNSVFDLPSLDQVVTSDLYDIPMFVINQKKGMDNIHEQIANKVNLGNRVQMDMGGGMGGDMGMGGGMDMGGGMGETPTGSDGTLSGLPDLSPDMNMSSGSDTSATAPAESGANDEATVGGTMPDIKF